MKIQVDRDLIKTILLALNGGWRFDKDTDNVIYARDICKEELKKLLIDNPLPEKWAVVEVKVNVKPDTRPGVVGFIPELKPTILKMVDSEDAGWKYVNELSRERGSDCRVVKVEDD